jgi:predicted phosphodiesterase
MQVPERPIRIGVVADVHQDVIHDGYARMRTFIDEMQTSKPDFLIQLGDFVLPRPRNQPFLECWNEFEGPRYHVLGNHDMVDFGYTKQQTMEWWEMPQRFYSFDAGGWHFVVLDGNDQNPGEWSGYVRYVAPDQLEWLRKDLAATNAPTMVFSHQTIESDSGVANSGEVRAVLEECNRLAGWPQVYACLCGHHHIDSLLEVEGIRYIHINSMSYKWVGDKYLHRRFPPHVEHAYPAVSKTAPYRDPLYTMLTLDPAAGTMSLSGKQTEFIPPAPQEMGIPAADRMLPHITARKLNVLPGSALLSE